MLRFSLKKKNKYEDERNKLLLEINHAILMGKEKQKEEEKKLLNLNAIFLLRIISILGLNGSVSARIALRRIVDTGLFAENKYLA